MVPLALSNATGASLPILEKLDFAGYWTWINKNFQFPNKKDAFNLIKKSKKPVTAMKVLAGGRLVEDINGSIKFCKDNGIKAVNLGVETEKQAEETFRIAQKYF